MERKSFFDEEVYASLRERLGALTAETPPRWGRMSSAQMCAHCAEVAAVAAGGPLDGTPWFIRLIGKWIKRMVLQEKPYPRSVKTHPQFEVSDSVAFEEQRGRLLAQLDQLFTAGATRAAETVHPLFGAMTEDEHGWLTYKHLDHHLTQFGA